MVLSNRKEDEVIFYQVHLEKHQVDKQLNMVIFQPNLFVKINKVL